MKFILGNYVKHNFLFPSAVSLIFLICINSLSHPPFRPFLSLVFLASSFRFPPAIFRVNAASKPRHRDKNCSEMSTNMELLDGMVRTRRSSRWFLLVFKNSSDSVVTFETVGLSRLGISRALEMAGNGNRTPTNHNSTT